MCRFQVFEQLLLHGEESTLHSFFKILKWSFNALLDGVFPQEDWDGIQHFNCNILQYIGACVAEETHLFNVFCIRNHICIDASTLGIARYSPGTDGYSRAGKPICGGWRAALVSLQGDLEFFAASLGLPRWNVKDGGCPICKCKAYGNLTWKKFSSWQHIADMEWEPSEWLAWGGKSKCPLFQATGVTACSVMLDWLHVKYLGNDQYLYASIFHLLSHVILPSASPLTNLLALWEDMKSLYRSLGIVHQYHYFNRLTMFQRRSGPPKLRGKGAEIHHLHKVMLHLWLKYYNPNLSVHRQILLVLKLNSKVEDLLDEHKQYVALPHAAAKELLDSCCSMLHLQSLLYDHFAEEPTQLFNLTLKSHDILHLAGHSHQVNPRLVWNFSGESNMGILKELGANCVKGVAPEDACTKMLHHWSYGMHLQLLKR